MIKAMRLGGGLRASDTSMLRVLAMQLQSPLCVFFPHLGSSAVWGIDREGAEETYGVQSLMKALTMTTSRRKIGEIAAASRSFAYFEHIETMKCGEESRRCPMVRRVYLAEAVLFIFAEPQLRNQRKRKTRSQPLITGAAHPLGD